MDTNVPDRRRLLGIILNHFEFNEGARTDWLKVIDHALRPLSVREVHNVMTYAY